MREEGEMFFTLSENRLKSINKFIASFILSIIHVVDMPLTYGRLRVSFAISRADYILFLPVTAFDKDIRL